MGDLSGVSLEDSFVLEIVEEPSTLRFRLEAVLIPQHPAYRPPRPNEQHCYANGWPVFGDVVKLDWQRRSQSHFTDAAGEVDLGNIDHLKRENDHWTLGGDWGDVLVHTRTAPHLILEGVTGSA